MIFHPDLAAKVIAGEKTVTRRPTGGLCVCPYETGRTYAVQPGRGKHAIGRIRILSSHSEHLSELTDDEAKLEGFADAAAFRERWNAMYRRAIPIVWRIEFEVMRA